MSITLMLRYDVVTRRSAVQSRSLRRVARPRRPGSRPSVARRRDTEAGTAGSVPPRSSDRDGPPVGGLHTGPPVVGLATRGAQHLLHDSDLARDLVPGDTRPAVGVEIGERDRPPG